jgi:hypothetical protein
MTRLLQHLLSAPLDPRARDPREAFAPSWIDDDIALGCECATPALQFEQWDPALPQTPSAPAY